MPPLEVVFFCVVRGRVVPVVLVVAGLVVVTAALVVGTSLVSDDSVRDSLHDSLI